MAGKSGWELGGCKDVQSACVKMDVRGGLLRRFETKKRRLRRNWEVLENELFAI